MGLIQVYESPVTGELFRLSSKDQYLQHLRGAVIKRRFTEILNSNLPVTFRKRSIKFIKELESYRFKEANLVLDMVAFSAHLEKVFRTYSQEIAYASIRQDIIEFGLHIFFYVGTKEQKPFEKNIILRRSLEALNILYEKNLLQTSAYTVNKKDIFLKMEKRYGNITGISFCAYPNELHLKNDISDIKALTGISGSYFDSLEYTRINIKTVHILAALSIIGDIKELKKYWATTTSLPSRYINAPGASPEVEKSILSRAFKTVEQYDTFELELNDKKQYTETLNKLKFIHKLRHGVDLDHMINTIYSPFLADQTYWD